MHRGNSETLIHGRWRRWLRHDNRLLEIQNSSVAIIVGLIFFVDAIFDGNLYRRFPDTYRWMEWAPTWLWGCVYSAAGLAHLVTLQLEMHSTRKQVLWIKGGLWVFLAGCVLSGDAYAASGWIYLVFAIFAFRGFLKVRLMSNDRSHIRSA